MSKQTGVKIGYNVDNGLVLRSSAIFYFRQGIAFKTSISFMNYWKIKRDLDVTIVASLRKMNGALMKREILEFNNGEVINYSPLENTEFEGSLEIEVFALKNMVIPYAGIVVVYETKKGVSMVHSYTRVYSNHEIEEGRTITQGEECCIPIRDSDNVESFTILHNGTRICPNQRAHLSILNSKGERKETILSLPEFHPYETIKIRHSDYIQNLSEFLDEKTGYASLSFLIKDSFTRMLVCNMKKDDSDFQVCHSDFNYSRHLTDKMPDGKFAFMYAPRLEGSQEYVIVYPDCDPGDYEMVCHDGKKIPFNENKAILFPMIGDDSEEFVFRKNNGPVPKRIHTGLQISKSNSLLPAEACLGICYEDMASKRFFWGICAANPKMQSRLIFQQFPWGGKEEDRKSKLIIKLYSERDHSSKEITINPLELRNGKFISDLFHDAEEFLGDGFGWYTLFSHHPNGMAYSTLENKEGSIAFEHSI